MSKILLIMLVAMVLLVAGCQYFEGPAEEWKGSSGTTACPKPKALMLSYFNGWNGLLDDKSTSYFDIILYNYGHVEAKNLTVYCYIEDNNNIVWAGEKNIGSVGSTSYVSRTVNFETDSTYSERAIGMCYISSCIDCINLNTRMPEFNEMIE